MAIKCNLCEYESDLEDDYHNWRSTKEQPLTMYPVFPNGNPKKEPKGFICARCLQEAKRSRSYMKTVASGIILTNHVLDRYIERCKADHLDRETAKVALAKEFSHAKKIRIKQKWLIRRFFNNNCKAANYYFDGGFIYITTNDENPPTLLTVEPVGRKKLGRDFCYEEDYIFQANTRRFKKLRKEKLPVATTADSDLVNKDPSTLTSVDVKSDPVIDSCYDWWAEAVYRLRESEIQYRNNNIESAKTEISLSIYYCAFKAVQIWEPAKVSDIKGHKAIIEYIDRCFIKKNEVGVIVQAAKELIRELDSTNLQFKEAWLKAANFLNRFVSLAPKEKNLTPVELPKNKMQTNPWLNY